MPVLEVYHRIRYEAVEIIDPTMALSPPDPFGIDDPCPENAGGPHRFIADCDEVVCMCGRIAWQ